MFKIRSVDGDISNGWAMSGGWTNAISNVKYTLIYFSRLLCLTFNLPFDGEKSWVGECYVHTQYTTWTLCTQQLMIEHVVLDDIESTES